MMINLQNVSFKAHVPVQYYAQNPANGKFVPVMKKENVKKCHSFVVRNLNGTAVKNRNDEFISYYASYDKDYRRNPVVHSVYDNNSPTVYLVSGKDVDVVRELAKPVGKAKRESIDRLGQSQSFETASAANDFFKNVKAFFDNGCKRVKSSQGDDIALRVYFTPKYNKKAKLVGFDFVNARFIKDKK